MRPGEKTLRLLIEPIQQWLDDPSVTDLCINRPGEVWVERLGVWCCHPVPLPFPALDAIATLAAAMTAQDVGPDKPLCATMLPDGQRVQICRPPAVAPGLLTITIRRPASFPPTVARLADTGLFSAGPDHVALVDKAERDLWHACAVHVGRRVVVDEDPDRGCDCVREDFAGPRPDRRDRRRRAAGHHRGHPGMGGSAAPQPGGPLLQQGRPRHGPRDVR